MKNIGTKMLFAWVILLRMGTMRGTACVCVRVQVRVGGDSMVRSRAGVPCRCARAGVRVQVCVHGTCACRCGKIVSMYGSCRVCLFIECAQCGEVCVHSTQSGACVDV